MAECAPWTHDFAVDPRPADWRQQTVTCTRCGEVRGAFDGQTKKSAAQV